MILLEHECPSFRTWGNYDIVWAILFLIALSFCLGWFAHWVYIHWHDGESTNDKH